MREGEAFERKVMRILSSETTDGHHGRHPDLEVFLDALGGDLPAERRAQMVAHTATCPPCAARWRELSRLLEDEAAMLDEKARVGTLQKRVHATRAEPRREGVSQSLIARVRRLTSGPVLRPALAYATTAVAAVAMTLGVGFQVLRLHVVPAAQVFTRADAEELLIEQEQLLTQLHSEHLAALQITASLPGFEPGLIDVDKELLARLIVQAGELDDPWQRALYLASHLARLGVRIPSGFDFANLEEYVVQEGDTWESIAEEWIAVPGLWPLLVVLNANQVGETLTLESGDTLWVPSRGQR